MAAFARAACSCPPSARSPERRARGRLQRAKRLDARGCSPRCQTPDSHCARRPPDKWPTFVAALGRSGTCRTGDCAAPSSAARGARDLHGSSVSREKPAPHTREARRLLVLAATAPFHGPRSSSTAWIRAREAPPTVVVVTARRWGGWPRDSFRSRPQRWPVGSGCRLNPRAVPASPLRDYLFPSRTRARFAEELLGARLRADFSRAQVARRRPRRRWRTRWSPPAPEYGLYRSIVCRRRALSILAATDQRPDQRDLDRSPLGDRYVRWIRKPRGASARFPVMRDPARDHVAAAGRSLPLHLAPVIGVSRQVRHSARARPIKTVRHCRRWARATTPLYRLWLTLTDGGGFHAETAAIGLGAIAS